MTPTKFPGCNRVWGGDNYLPLPAFTDATYTISCWRLSWRERLRVLLGAPLWLSQMNFGQSLQPQRISLDTPFAEDSTQ